MTYLTSLTLNHFRNYDTARITDLSDGFVVLYGENGAGKTNILEAVSMLCPGRGLRSAKLYEIQSKANSTPWAVACEARTQIGPTKIGTGTSPDSGKRIVRINGETAKSQNELAEYINCLWLTPQMDGLFSGGASERRRFFDRLIATFDRAHTGRLTRYENALRQRMKLLLDDTKQLDATWVSALEKEIAETGVAVSAARLDFMDKLNIVTEKLHQEHATGDFPQAHFDLRGDVETALRDQPAVTVEDMIRVQLAQLRDVDMRAKTTTFGTHKCDIHTKHIDKNMPAHQCSTGEQKALLTGIVLAHRHMIHQSKSQMPLLLLDEVAAHFDLKRRASLFDFLTELGGQIWMTGTDSNLFDTISKNNQKYKVNQGVICTG